MAEPTKTCTKCGETKPASEFHKQGKYRKSRCRECTKGENAGSYAKLTDEQKERYKRTDRAKRYGLTLEEYDALVGQHERCPICLATESDGVGWVIDHDHETGKVRGILCSECNLGLGKFKDNLASLTRAQAYLEVNNGATA